MKQLLITISLLLSMFTAYSQVDIKPCSPQDTCINKVQLYEVRGAIKTMLRIDSLNREEIKLQSIALAEKDNSIDYLEEELNTERQLRVEAEDNFDAVSKMAKANLEKLTKVNADLQEEKPKKFKWAGFGAGAGFIIALLILL
jgi:hypothetical protein